MSGEHTFSQERLYSQSMHNDQRIIIFTHSPKSQSHEHFRSASRVSGITRRRTARHTAHAGWRSGSLHFPHREIRQCNHTPHKAQRINIEIAKPCSPMEPPHRNSQALLPRLSQQELLSPPHLPPPLPVAPPLVACPPPPPRPHVPLHPTPLGRLCLNQPRPRPSSLPLRGGVGGGSSHSRWLAAQEAGGSPPLHARVPPSEQVRSLPPPSKQVRWLPPPSEQGRARGRAGGRRR